MDLWRLDDASSRPIVDFQEVFSNGIALIEWPDRLKSLQPPERLDVFLEYSSVIRGDGPDEESSLKSLDDPWGFDSDDFEQTCSNISRHIRLVPNGDYWEKRIEDFCNRYVDRRPNGKSVLKNS